ncbi:MAG: T9SS type A sorting domain-containing protein [Bacteroidetes bacterium]|nr:T9SS type A sorting domain-containing protein [Bacteroidota bacterium]
MFLPDATIDIINMQGKIVLSKNAAINKDVAFLININTLPAGNYFLRIKGNGTQFVEKLVVTK